MKKLIGDQGEKQIQKYIQHLGWSIIQTNFHTRFGEIDIIAKDGDEIVFVEVKTRTNDLFGRPEESVSKGKMRKMLLTAHLFLLQNKWETCVYRFDVFSIMKNSDRLQIEHFKNIQI